MAAYFSKELPDQPIYVNGAPVRFSCLKTEDQWLITELRNAIKQGIGGVYELADEAAYNECVKKKNEEKSRLNSRNLLSATMLPPPHLNHPQFRQAGKRVAAVESKPPGELPDPLTVPDPKSFTMPTVGKLPV